MLEMKAFLIWCRKYPLKVIPFLAMFTGLAVAIGIVDPLNVPMILAYILLAGFFVVIIWKDSKGTL